MHQVATEQPHPGNAVLEISLSRQYWHLVAHRRELPSNNDYLKLKWAQGDIVIFNDGGNLIAFDNLCPHRGTRFFVEEHGNAPAHCPYHGWSYREGKIHIPNPDRFKPCDLASVRLNTFQMDWAGDFLFVSVAPKMPLCEQLGDIMPLLEDISFNIAGRFDFNHYTYECNWRIALENALEPYHIDLIHPNSLGTLCLTDGENHFHGLNSVWHASIGNASLNKRLKSINRLFTLDFQYEGYLSLYIFPYAMLSSTYGFSYSLQNFFPTDDPDRTHFSSRLLTTHVLPDKQAVAEAFFQSTMAINRQVFEEDHEICRRVPRGAIMSHTILADNEEKILHFRASITQENDM